MVGWLGDPMIIVPLRGPTCNIAKFQAMLKFPSWTRVWQQTDKKYLGFNWWGQTNTKYLGPYGGTDEHKIPWTDSVGWVGG